MSYFIIHEIHHIILAFLTSLFIWLFFKKKNLLVFSFLLSLGVDIDHLFDYFHYFGFKDVHLPFNGPNYFCLSGKIFVPFHGWEYIILLFVAGLIIKKWKPLLFTIAITLSTHFLLDQFTHAMYPLTYSLIYRIINNFDINEVSWGCLIK